MRQVFAPPDLSHNELERLPRSPEVEALQLWAVAVGLGLVVGGIYIAGLSVMSALGPGQ